jgi:hypothetical protein
MKQFLSILIVSLVISVPLKTHSQTIEDTVCIPTKDALKVLAAADSAKVHKLHIILLKEDLQILQITIKELQKAVLKAELADSLSRDNLRIALAKETVLKDRIVLAEGLAASWEKLYRKANRRTWWTAAAGFVTTGAAVVIPFLLKK